MRCPLEWARAMPRQIITAYRPHAVEVKVTSRTGKKVHTMEKVTDEGFYAIFFPKKEFSPAPVSSVHKYFISQLLFQCYPIIVKLQHLKTPIRNIETIAIS